MGPLSTADVTPLLLAAVPSFSPEWDALKDAWRDQGDVPPYVAAGALARFAVSLAEHGRRPELVLLFDAIEELHVRGDASVRELATMGFLEA